MGQEVSKSIDPHEIVNRDVNQSGQVYIGREFAGESVTVAYEVNRSEPSKTSPKPESSSGAASHQYILEQCVSTLNQLGISEYSVPKQQGMRSIPDAIANLPWGEPITDPSTTGIREQISKGSDMRIEAATSTLQRPYQILGYLSSAIRSGKTLVLAIPRAQKESIEHIIYGHNDDGTIDYGSIVCRDTAKAPVQFYTSSRKKYLRYDFDSGVFPVWVEKDDRIVCVRHDEPDSTPLAEFNPANTTVTGNEADVVTTNLAEMPTEGVTPVNLPYVPETRFDRELQKSDFSILLFPDSDRESDVPQLYEKGECIPIFDY